MVMGWGLCLMRLAVVVVTMSPQNQFLEYEEKHDAEQDRCGHAVRFAVFQRVGQNFQESSAQQCTNCIRNQYVDALCTEGRADRCRRYDARGICRSCRR